MKRNPLTAAIVEALGPEYFPDPVPVNEPVWRGFDYGRDDATVITYRVDAEPQRSYVVDDILRLAASLTPPYTPPRCRWCHEQIDIFGCWCEEWTQAWSSHWRDL